MEERQRNRRRTIIIFLAIVAVVMCVIIVVSVLLLGKKDDSYRIVSMPLGMAVSDYKESRLNIYENGTFDVKIIYKSDKQFAGIGTYTKTKDEYIFFYVDASDATYINLTIPYQILKNNRINFTLLGGQAYVFGK